MVQEKIKTSGLNQVEREGILNKISDADTRNLVKELLEKIVLLESAGHAAANKEEEIQQLFPQLRPRKEESKQHYFERILSLIAKHLRVHRACFYLVRHKRAEVVSTYACESRPDDFEYGDGLIGQMMIDKKMVVKNGSGISEIHSGLGNAVAQNLMIVPCISGDTLTAILECSAFHDFDQKTLLLVQRFADIIAPFAEGILRQEMSEEHVKAMQHLQREMEIREQVFGCTTILSESDIYGTVTYVNDKLCEVSEYTREEMLGKPHSLFRHPDMPGEIFKELWEQLKAGKVFRGIIKNKTKSGGHYWVEATIVPVMDHDGNIIKYVSARFHIRNEELAQEMFAEFLHERMECAWK